jgi:hypothetical protein
MGTEDEVSRRGRERRGLRDGSDRIARIARWLSAKPVNADVRELVLSLEDGDVLGRWPVDTVLPSMAPAINDLILDAANDAGSTIGAKLHWERENGTSYLSKGFRAKCDDEDRETVRPLDGSMMSLLSANQRHTEALAQQVAQFCAGSEARVERFLAIQERLIEKLCVQLDNSEKRRVQAEAGEQEALELATTAMESGEAAVKEAAEVVAQKDDVVSKVIDIGIKQLTGGAIAK